MRTAMFAALGITILAATTAYGAGAQQATTCGSFLRHRANSAQELTSMVRRDPKLASRYAKHFGTTNYGVADYFGKRLRLIRLGKATTTSVYYYNARGQMIRGRRVMPAGTLVFATESGAPVLDWRCGNPLTSKLPVRQAIRPTDKTLTGPDVKTGAAPKGAVKVAKVLTPDADRIVEKVLAIPASELAAVATVTPSAAAETLATTTVAATAPVAAASVAPVVTGAALPPIAEIAAIPAVSAVGTIPVIAGGSGGFSWLFPLAALGGAAGMVGHKTSHSDTIIPPPDDTKVPEPSSLLPLAAGLATACTAALRKRRQFLR